MVALVEDAGATVKKIYFEKGRVRLQPANSKYQPMILTSEMVKVQTDHSDVTMIVISLTFSESLGFEKKMIERKLVLLLENLFLTDSSASHFLILSVILMIQTSASLRALLSDFLKSLSLISAFLNSFNVILTDLFTLLVS